MDLINVTNPFKETTLLTLNRAHKRNALNLSLMTELIAKVQEAEKTARVMIINAEGADFCAGLDLNEATDPEGSEHLIRTVGKMLKTVYTSPCVTIAAVQGKAFAGGAALMTACDFAIAEENAFFCFPEVKRGLIPAVAAALLIRQLPFRVIKELLLFGETINAKRAYQIHLINAIIDKENLLSESFLEAKKALVGGPMATKKTKKLLDQLTTITFADGLNLALQYHAETLDSAEAKEGIEAFFEKRKTKWCKEGDD